MSASIRAAFLVISLGLLSGCATSFRSDVTRFHNLAAPQGETVRVVAADAAKANSLEFATYAAQASRALAGVGFQSVDPGNSAAATYTAKLDYAIDMGRQKIVTDNYYGGGYYGPYYGYGGGFGGYHRGYGGGYGRLFYDPFYTPFYYGGYGGFYQPQVYSYTIYTRSLTLTIERADGTHVFEGRAESVGSNPRLSEVVPYLIQAMFTDFPGMSGRTQRVTVPVPPRH